MHATWGRSLAALLCGAGLLLAGCGQDEALKVQLAPPPAASSQPPVGRSSAPAAVESPHLASPTVVEEEQPTSAAGKTIPSGERLKIPSIGVDAPIETLSVDDNGVMQVPSNGTDVGWYTFSALPGSPGNAVISGHLDTTTSYRAVFYRLKDLKQGDDISLTDGAKQTDFQVFWTKSWADDTAPLALILGNAPSPTLTLITCDGTFNRASKNYSNRLVVRAKLPGSI